MIISTCGFGNTGSSAVIDYLKQFKNLNVYAEFEFQLIHQIDGINDLKYYITKNCDRVSCNSAIHRFLKTQKVGYFGRKMRSIVGKYYDDWCNEYINELVITSWNGYRSAFDASDISKFSNSDMSYRISNRINNYIKKINKKMHFPKYKKRYFSILSEKEFDNITKKYINILLNKIGIDNNEINVIDMLFSATNPSMGMEFFENAKAIVVIRDPRDVFVSAKANLDDSRFMPNNDGIGFSRYYKKLMKTIKTNNNVLLLKYEDLIYHYVDTTKLIQNFLHLNEDNLEEFKFFDPTISYKYTNRKNLYDIYIEDIEIIKKELKEYLYDFDNAKNPVEDARILEKKKTCNNTYTELKKYY